jgi:hypothetical protein
MGGRIEKEYVHRNQTGFIIIWTLKIEHFVSEAVVISILSFRDISD